MFTSVIGAGENGGHPDTARHTQSGRMAPTGSSDRFSALEVKTDRSKIGFPWKKRSSPPFKQTTMLFRRWEECLPGGGL